MGSNMRWKRWGRKRPRSRWVRAYLMRHKWEAEHPSPRRRVGQFAVVVGRRVEFHEPEERVFYPRHGRHLVTSAREFMPEGTMAGDHRDRFYATPAAAKQAARWWNGLAVAAHPQLLAMRDAAEAARLRDE